MKHLFQFVTEHRRSVALFLTIFLSVSMMLMGEGAKNHFARVVTTAVFNSGRFTFSWGIYMLDLWRDNRRLRLQNLDLSDKVNQNTLAVRENERLRKLLELKENKSYSVVSATVIGRDMDRVVNSLILDVGRRDGVRRNMACVTADGLVGRIYDVYPSSSSVLIIADIKSRISAMVENEEAFGIISWDGGKNLKMYGLPLINNVKPGQRVYTTGDGGVFPRGILVGTVGRKPIREVEIYASLNIEPAVDFSRVHELFVLKGSENSDIWNDGGQGGAFQRPSLQ
ncbi:MAG: rod shape-determining protein MreC [Candidatus Latescibacterota bacterium]